MSEEIQLCLYHESYYVDKKMKLCFFFKDSDEIITLDNGDKRVTRNARVRKQQSDKDLLKWNLHEKITIAEIEDLSRAENIRTVAKLSYLKSDIEQKKI